MSKAFFNLSFSAILLVITPVLHGSSKTRQIVENIEDMFYYDNLDLYPATGSLKFKDLFVNFIKKYHKKYSSKEEIKLRYELFKLKVSVGGDYDEKSDLTKTELDDLVHLSKYDKKGNLYEEGNSSQSTNVKWDITNEYGDPNGSAHINTPITINNLNDTNNNQSKMLTVISRKTGRQDKESINKFKYNTKKLNETKCWSVIRNITGNASAYELIELTSQTPDIESDIKSTYDFFVVKNKASSKFLWVP